MDPKIIIAMLNKLSEVVDDWEHYDDRESRVSASMWAETFMVFVKAYAEVQEIPIGLYVPNTPTGVTPPETGL